MSFLLPIATRILGGAVTKNSVSRAAAFSLGRNSAKSKEDQPPATDTAQPYPSV